MNMTILFTNHHSCQHLRPWVVRATEDQRQIVGIELVVGRPKIAHRSAYRTPCGRRPKC